MAQNSGSSSTPWLAFLVGALVVAVAVIGYFVYAGGAATKPELDLQHQWAPPYYYRPSPFLGPFSCVVFGWT